MHRPRSKRNQIIRATIVYTVMITAIVVGLTIGVLYTLGYRLNTAERTIEQGGLLQINSVPTGARVTVDQRQLSGTTPQRLDARAGSHTLRLERDGYRPWLKTVTVDPGIVHWANYARLVPLEPEESVVQRFSSLSGVLPATNRDLILAQESASSGQFSLIDVSGNSVEQTTLRLPENLTANLSSGTAGQYRMVAWDEADRLVLIEHRAGQNSQWIVLDTRSVENSINVSRLLEGAGNIKSLMFNERNGRMMYVLAGNVLRQIDTSDGSLSAPLAQDVKQFWQSNDGVVTFATLADENGYRRLGYYTHGADTSKTIERLKAPDSANLAVAAGEYLGRQYLALYQGDTVRVLRQSLHASDSQAELESSLVATIPVPSRLEELSFSPHDRFVFIQYGATFINYDIELDKSTTTTVQGDRPVDRRLGWLDRYHIWSDRGGQLRWYEFDGENTQSITDMARGFAPKLTDNGRFVYVIQSNDDGYQLVQVSLRV